MSRLPLTPEVTDAVQTIYGDHGLEWCKEVSYYMPELDEAGLLAAFRNEPCSLETRFFGHYDTLAQFAAHAAPELLADTASIDIAQVGATGPEAWSLSTLLRHGQSPAPYHIYGYNVNRQTLSEARGPFPTTIDDMSYQARHRIRPATLRQDYEETPRGIVPRDELVAQSTFRYHDIIENALPERTVDAIVMCDVLWHYPTETRHHIMANVMDALRPEGAFVFEGVTRDNQQMPGYWEWTRQLPEYGLWASPVPQGTRILTYRPEAAIEVFETSRNVMDALGILSTAQHGLQAS